MERSTEIDALVDAWFAGATRGDASLGWAATKLTLRLPDGRQVTPRRTAVFVREDGVWRFVQTHASIGVANEDVGWTYA